MSTSMGRVSTAEIAEALWDGVAEVIRSQKKPRAALRVLLHNRWPRDRVDVSSASTENIF
jgi:hypothetical protein